MRLTDQNIKDIKPIKVFRDYKSKINHMSFSDNGNRLIASSDDDQITIYDCQIGTLLQTVFSKKYGCTFAQFTHTNSQAIHGSNKVDDTIRYLSLFDNKYLRYYPGHTKRVTALEISPVDDTFISGSMDNTMRLWDLRSPNCQGYMALDAAPVITFDPEGLLFAVGLNSTEIKLYDLRSYDKGPFTTFYIERSRIPGVTWEKIKFSPNGKLLAISSNGPELLLLDGYKGNVLRHFMIPSNAATHLPINFDFTPESAFLFCTSPEANINVWNLITGQKVAMLPTYEMAAKTNHPIYNVAFNPRYGLLTTGSNVVSLWLSNLEDED